MSRYYELLRQRAHDHELAFSPRVPRLPSHPIEPLGPASNEATITSYARTVWRRKWTVICVAAFAVFSALIVSLAMSPTYEAVARIAIYKENQGLLDVKQNNSQASDDSDYTVTLETQAKIIESDSLAAAVVRKVHLDRNPAFIGRPTDESSRRAVQKFQESLRVVKVPHTRLLEIRFNSTNPQLSADLANEVANAYIDHTYKVRYDTTIQASKRLSDELTNLQEATNHSEARLLEYQRTHRMVGADELINSRLTDLSKDLTQLEVERTEKEAQYKLARSDNPDIVERNDPDSLLVKLREREYQLSAEYAKLTSVLGDANPQVIAVNNQIAEVQRAIRRELDHIRKRVTNQYVAITRRENWLRRALEKQKEDAARHNQDSIEYNNLKRDADSNRQLYTDLLKKLKEAQVAAGLRADYIRIEGIAAVPQRPSRPDIPFNLGLALFCGLIGGVMVALIRDHLDASVRNAEEAEHISGVPALALIPKGEYQIGDGSTKHSWATRSSTPLPTAMIVNPSSPAIEPYRALRTLLLLHFSECSPQVLLITSSLQREGKTTTAVNAAIAFSPNARRVLIIDADFRNSSVCKMWGITPGAQGLSSVVETPSLLHEALLRAPGHDNLFVLPPGATPADPAEFLSRDNVRHFITTLRQQFDFVIVDGPPVLGVSDTLVLAGLVDAVLLVVRESNTPKHALAKTRQLLSKANAPDMCVVVNEVDRSNLAEYPYYQYRANLA